MKLRIGKNFDKWKDELICPNCKEREVMSYWHVRQKIIEADFGFQCKNCFAKFDKKGNELIKGSLTTKKNRRIKNEK